MKNKKNIIIVLAIIIILWLIGIFLLSNMNSKSSNEASTDVLSSVIKNIYEFTSNNPENMPSDKNIEIAVKVLNTPARKFMHMFVYCILGFITITITNVIKKKPSYLKSLLISLIICFIFASIDEYHQTFVGRTGQFKDVIIDMAGVIIGLLFYGTYYLVYTITKKKDL